MQNCNTHDLAVHKNVCDDIENFINIAKSIASELKFEKDNAQHYFLMLLHARILELSQSCLILILANFYTGTTILIRSIIEALANLSMIKKDADFIDILIFNHYDQLKKLGNEIAKQNLIGGREVKHAAILLESEQRVKHLGNKPNVKKYKSLTKRISTFLPQKYLLIYIKLCIDTHNNIQALENRHTTTTDNDYSVGIFKTESVDSKFGSIDTFLEALLLSTSYIQEVLYSNDEAISRALLDSLKTFRKKYYPDEPRETFS